MQYRNEEWDLNTASEQNYHAFLLRCWPEKANGGNTWRFTLVHVENAQVKKVFNSLEDLTSYLHGLLQ
jgi:hypothetical protein